MEKVDAVREQALKILIKVLEDKAYSNILIKNLGQKFSVLDRSFITEIVYGTLKWRLKIDNAIAQLSKVRQDKISVPIINILRLGIYQIEFMDKVPPSAAVDECVKLAKKYSNIGAAKYVNAILRNYIRNHDDITYPKKEENIIKFLSVFYSYPEWLVEKLVQELGPLFTEEFLKASNSVPALTVRVNNLKTDKKSLIKKLSQSGIEASDSQYISDALILKNVPGIESMEEYRKGYFSVQDESSMLAALILSPKPGEFVMDVCSAPGTKSTYIAELMENKGTILSGDVSINKLKLVDENAKRLGINIIRTINSDASKTKSEYLGKADRLLIDAPCSGFGLMRKKPEIRWNRALDDIQEIEALQEAILNASSKYLKIGGIMVYSTCTVLREENLDMVHRFLNNNRNFIMEDITDLIPDKLRKENCRNGYLELYPNVHGIDGFFISRLKRVK